MKKTILIVCLIALASCSEPNAPVVPAKSWMAGTWVGHEQAVNGGPDYEFTLSIQDTSGTIVATNYPFGTSGTVTVQHGAHPSIAWFQNGRTDIFHLTASADSNSAQCEHTVEVIDTNGSLAISGMLSFALVKH